MAEKQETMTTDEREKLAYEGLLKIAKTYRVVFHPSAPEVERTRSGMVVIHPPVVAVTALATEPDEEAQ